MTPEEQKQLAIKEYEKSLIEQQENKILQAELCNLRQLARIKEHFKYWKSVFPSIEISEEKACYILCGYEFEMTDYAHGAMENYLICPNKQLPIGNTISKIYGYIKTPVDLGRFLRLNENPPEETKTVTVDIPKGFTAYEIEKLVNSLSR